MSKNTPVKTQADIVQTKQADLRDSTTRKVAKLATCYASQWSRFVHGRKSRISLARDYRNVKFRKQSLNYCVTVIQNYGLVTINQKAKTVMES